jgi:hypothetical protein
MPREQRMAVVRNHRGQWVIDKKSRCTSKKVSVDAERKQLKKKWAERLKKMKGAEWLIKR